MTGKTILKKLALISMVLLVCSVFTIGSSFAGDKVYRWKLQSGYPHGDLSFELLKGFAADVKKFSNGKLVISVFADAEIVPLEQLFESTQRGVLDILHCMGAFWGGIVPVGEIEFGIPFAYTIDEADTFAAKGEVIRDFYYEKGFVDLLRQEYGKHGLYWLDMHTYGGPFVLSTKPLDTYDDWKGVKIRDEGIYTQFHNMIGARGTYVSGGEAYMALKLGTLDASQWDISAISGLKWHEVAPYWVQAGDNDHVIGHMLINDKSWKSLPENLQIALQKAAKNYWTATVKGYGAEFENAKKMVEKGTLKVSRVKPEAIEKHKKIAHEIWDEVATRDAASAKAIQMIKEWRGVK
ncbi:TRAP transporter substrate-binding protein DctP [Desulfobacula sp.]|uniref:TRAP transporter substrate-binding protein DctP n=1 Tax=Desulfobacula sp. TaxID=2593537 RepID=UPI002615A572|nr:TRAP transporter substrate-binding protein DctP [Desulfobacula sp.]